MLCFDVSITIWIGEGPVQRSERVSRDLKLREFRILLTVAQQGSMAKSAVLLGISQPAVSKAIRDIENVVGLRLLDRSRHGVEPTAYGRVLVKRGLAIFDELKQGVEELEFLADPASGQLRIGSNETMAAGVLPAIIDMMSRQYPRITLQVAQAVLSETQYRELRERQVDLWFGRIPDPFDQEDLNADILFNDPVAVVAGQGHRLARRRKIELAELMGEAWILPPRGSLPGGLAERLFGTAGLQLPRAQLTTMSLHLTCNLLATGRYVAMLPRSLLRFNITNAGLKILSVGLPIQVRPVAIVTLKNRMQSPIAGLFVDSARVVAKRLVK
ncbi:MAG: LysR family transcriptional regulator [Rhodospirillales bacterium]|nr:LysR family transcriptional regulator [Rhodospirillales bacterium]